VSARRYYGDLVIGEVRESRARTVALDEIVAFARIYDPQYFHADVEAARGSRFGEVIASGIYTMALWRQLDHEISGDIAWICGVGWEEVTGPPAGRAGDQLRARAMGLAKRPSQSDPTRGVVEFRYELLNQREQIAWTCRSINLVEIASRGN
jgi:acyl dehydratase